MRLIEIEAWALRILESVRAGHPIEDARVELKSEWPTDHMRAARQLAGHANAARGEPILWLFGINEGELSVPGVSAEERSNWWAQVSARFGDDVYPVPQDLAIPTDGVAVVAIVFETDRAPYVVKVAEGGSIQFEVPWREATGVRTAKRSQLILMLAEAIALPGLEVFWAEVSAVVREGALDLLELDATAACYFDSDPKARIVFPFHRCRATLSSTPSSWANLEPPQFRMTAGTDPATNVVATDADLSLMGPARVAVQSWGQVAFPGEPPAGDLRMVVELFPTRSDRGIFFEVLIPFKGEQPPDGTVRQRWSWSSKPG